MLEGDLHYEVKTKKETKSQCTISVLLLPKFENTSGIKWYLGLRMLILYTIFCHSSIAYIINLKISEYNTLLTLSQTSLVEDIDSINQNCF